MAKSGATIELKPCLMCPQERVAWTWVELPLIHVLHPPEAQRNWLASGFDAEPGFGGGRVLARIPTACLWVQSHGDGAWMGPLGPAGLSPYNRTAWKGNKGEKASWRMQRALWPQRNLSELQRQLQKYLLPLKSCSIKTSLQKDSWINNAICMPGQTCYCCTKANIKQHLCVIHQNGNKGQKVSKSPSVFSLLSGSGKDSQHLGTGCGTAPAPHSPASGHLQTPPPFD